MSFVEKHKAWLLPLLGVGIAAVVLMNVKLLSAKPAPPPVSPDAPPPAAPEPAVAPPVAAQAGPQETETADLWADLRPLAVVPSELGEAAALRDRARMSLPDPQARTASPAVPPPTLRAETPAKRPEKAEAEAPPPPPPELDFLLRTPGGGARAWIAGHAYVQGQALAGSPYRVKRIGASKVLLSGPAGSTLRSTNPLDEPDTGRPAPAEKP